MILVASPAARVGPSLIRAMSFLTFQLPFQIVFNFSFLEQWARLPFYLLMWEIFRNGGWLLFIYVFAKGFPMVWLYTRQMRWAGKQKYVLLAVDVPKDNEQSPKAMENFFTALAGAHGSTNFVERWFQGQFQLSFSIELISIDGYVQFIIYTPLSFKDLVESAIFSQYPDAEISEVSDYTDNTPQTWPDPEWDLWGAEYTFSKNEAYPIKTWKEFEHTTDEFAFKDPMASMLESLSSLHLGEQVWMQIIVVPIDDKWKVAADKVVGKLIGAKEKVKEPGLIHKIIFTPLEIIHNAFGAVLGIVHPEPAKKVDGPPSKIQFMSPGEIDAVKAIQAKSSKLGFKCKLRWLYVGRKEVFKKSRGVNSVIGAIKQYNTLNLNSLKPDKRTWVRAQYVFIKRRLTKRKNKIFRAYKYRSGARGGPLYVLNIEELATMWHFPLKTVRAPLVGKTAGKKGEPPSGLPIEMPFYAAASPAGGPAAPAGLPVEQGAPSAPTAGRPATPPATRPAPVNLPSPEELDIPLAPAPNTQPASPETQQAGGASGGPSSEPPANLPLAS